MKPALAPARLDHLAPLDGLRGLAIALVVWFHLWEITWLRADVTLFGRTFNFNTIPETGFVGVDLFFFISGFCLFYPYARTLFDGAPLQTVRVFAYRRVLKIVPSYVLLIALAILLGQAHFESLVDAVRQVVLHLLFVHTWFHDSYGSINGVLWSLGTEVQFYVVFPAICALAMRRPAFAFAGMFLIAGVYRLTIAHHFNIAYEVQQVPGTRDLFGAGMLGAYLFRALARRTPRLVARRTVWTALAIGGVVLCWFTIGNGYDARLRPDWPSAWLVWGRSLLSLSFLIITLGSLFAWPAWQRVLANPVLVFLSAISYNLYLWHQPVAGALHLAHLPPWTGADAHADPVWGLSFTFVALVAGVAVASLVSYGFERPLLRRRPFERAVARWGALRAASPGASATPVVRTTAASKRSP